MTTLVIAQARDTSARSFSYKYEYDSRFARHSESLDEESSYFIQKLRRRTYPQAWRGMRGCGRRLVRGADK